MTASRKAESLPPRDVLGKFLLGFEGTSLPDELRELLAAGLGGVAMYPRNFSSAKGLRALTDEIRRAADGPALIGIDQEGGTKFSLPEPFTQWPSPAELGRLDDAATVEAQAGAIARELRAVGVNLNFAPMLDLHVNPESPVTKGRSFGSDPHRVSRLGAAFIRGMRNEGILACAKHFPGHGDAPVDPHEDLPVYHGTAQQLDAADLVPFDGAIFESVSMIMTAHILLPEIDSARPASLSRKLLTEVLRERMGFCGMIVADDLGMGAIARRYGVGEAAIETFRAGSHMAMLCHDWNLVHPTIAIVAEVRERGGFVESEWNASGRRIGWARNAANTVDFASARPGLDVVGCAEHRRLAEEIRERANRKMLP